MVKMKTTKKWIENSYSNKIAIGYCGASTLLSFYNPIAYTSGVYGWNSDIYFIENCNVCISTGYRGLIHDMEYNYKELEALEKLATEIYSTKKYEDAKKEIVTMFENWLNKVKKENHRIPEAN